MYTRTPGVRSSRRGAPGVFHGTVPMVVGIHADVRPPRHRFSRLSCHPRRLIEDSSTDAWKSWDIVEVVGGIVGAHHSIEL